MDILCNIGTMVKVTISKSNVFVFIKPASIWYLSLVYKAHIDIYFSFIKHFTLNHIHSFTSNDFKFSLLPRSFSPAVYPCVFPLYIQSMHQHRMNVHGWLLGQNCIRACFKSSKCFPDVFNSMIYPLFLLNHEMSLFLLWDRVDRDYRDGNGG